MKLYLLQHAKAVSKDENPERPLTEEGSRDIKKVAAFIKSLSLSVDYLYHSGKTRAMQTAEVLAEVIMVKNEVAAHDGLAPNDDVRAIIEKINVDGRDVMIVGHLPFMAKLASLLLTGSESTTAVAFKQGSILCLDYSDECKWQVKWMITPDLLF
jgi:phosphohistidine phosphatase